MTIPGQPTNVVNMMGGQYPIAGVLAPQPGHTKHYKAYEGTLSATIILDFKTDSGKDYCTRGTIINIDSTNSFQAQFDMGDGLGFGDAMTIDPISGGINAMDLSNWIGFTRVKIVKGSGTPAYRAWLA